MKKVLFLAIAVVLLAGIYYVFAAETSQHKETEAEEDMMHSHGMCPCPMHGMMMGGMLQKSMVASGDGGVFVLAGDKLKKFDRDLNLVKEVDVPIDIEAMHKRLAPLMENCPMYKSMKEHHEGMMEHHGEKMQKSTE